MFDTKEDKISTIKSLMQNHKTLHQGFFGADEKLLPYVYAKFCEMINFVQNNYVSFLQNVEIEDIVLTGSLCGYVYDDSSDFDLFIILKDECKNGFILNDTIISSISNFLNFKLKPKVKGHSVDIGLMPKSAYYNDSQYATYSIIRNDWNQKPIYGQFDYTVEQMFEKYCEFSHDFHQFVKELPKENDAFLTYDGIRQLDEKLLGMKKSAFMAKHDNPKHEYETQYLLYRLAKKFGLIRHFTSYVYDSYKYQLSKGKI